MAWVKLDDGFADHPKIAQVGPIGAWLQVQALCYSNRNLTDGFVPTSVAVGFIGRCLPWTNDQAWLDRMVEADLWSATPGGYRIHDYSEYQKTKAQVLSERETTRVRVQKFRGNAVSNTAPVPVPVPVPNPVPKKKNSEARSRSRRRPDSEVLTPELRAFASGLGLTSQAIEREWAAQGDHEYATPRSDWRAAFRNWCRRAAALAKPAESVLAPKSGGSLEYRIRMGL